MWIFTKYGFFSVVCGRTDGRVDKNVMMIRARKGLHLHELQKRFPKQLSGLEIQFSGITDYPCRLLVGKRTWEVIAKELAAEIDYDNFKSEVRLVGVNDPAYEHALHVVWARMTDLQTLPVPVFLKKKGDSK